MKLNLIGSHSRRMAAQLDGRRFFRPTETEPARNDALPGPPLPGR
jgi:hypothetical protein